MPPTDAVIETFFKLVQSDLNGAIQESREDPIRWNLTKEEFKSLNTLKNKREMIIKPADKGGAIVVQDKDKYINEIMRQLNDSSIYRKLPNDPSTALQERIDGVLSKALDDGIIDNDLERFLRVKFPITPVLYTLPKIHKSLEDPPGRPIVAAMDSLFSPLAQFLDSTLRPTLAHVKSFVKDSSEVLNYLRSIDVKDDLILVTFDVVSLYTSIQHEDGMESSHDAFTRLGYEDHKLEFLMVQE